MNSTRCERGTGGADESSMAANTNEAERQIGRLQRENSGYKSVQTKERLQREATRAYKQREATTGGYNLAYNKEGVHNTKNPYRTER